MRDDIRLVCYGSATPASPLVPKALGMVDRLRAVDSYASHVWKVNENQWIKVTLKGGDALVWIYDDGVQDTEQCDGYRSGMTQFGVSVYRYDPTSGAKINGGFSFQPSPAYAAQYKLNVGWQVGAAFGDVNYLSQPLFGIDGRIEPQIPPPWKLGEWTQVAYLKPGMYSGYMRYVVQILLGTTRTIEYDYRFVRTHGVFRGVTGKFQTDWLIEISQDNGVLAMRMPACYRSIPAGNTLGYVPSGRAFPTGDALAKAVASGEVKQLLPASGLSAIYGKTPFSPVYGWAFNYTGTKASIVVFANLPGDDYMTTYLYTVNIAGDGSKPSAATLTLETSGRAVGYGYAPNTYGKASFKIPLQVGGFAYPVNFGPPNQATYVPENCRAPLYVFYAKTGAQKVLWYQNSTPAMQRPSDELRRPRPSGNPFDPVGDLSWLASDANLGNTYVEYPIGTAGESLSQINQIVYIDDVKASPETQFPLRIEYKAAASSNYATAFQNARDYIYSDAGYFNAVLLAIKLIRSWRWTKADAAIACYSSAVIPNFEREAVAIHVCETMYYGSNAESYFTTTGTGAYHHVRVAASEISGSTKYRSDGTPIGVTFTASPGSANYSDTYTLIYGSLFDSQGDGCGLPAMGTVGGFGGKFGSTTVPPSITTPGNLTLQSEDAAFAGNRPYSGSSTTYGKYSRTAKKKVVTSHGDFDLVKKAGTNPDEFPEQSASFQPDPLWFSDVPTSYALIQTWDGGRRYSPSDLGTYDFNNSLLGPYSAPGQTGNEPLINFIGDA